MPDLQARKLLLGKEYFVGLENTSGTGINGIRTIFCILFHTLSLLFAVKLLLDHNNPLSANDIEKIALATKGYSGR